jgi:hypothetical protein
VVLALVDVDVDVPPSIVTVVESDAYGGVTPGGAEPTDSAGAMPQRWRP